MVESERAAASAREAMRIYDLVPELARLRADVLLGDVWEQPSLAKRDRSLVTCAILATTGRDDELASHVAKAIDNGATLEELRGLVIHVAFYAGWPAGLAVGRAALPFFLAEQEQAQAHGGA